MKRRFALNRRTHGRELLVTSQNGEILDTRRAKWLAESTHDVLLRFEYEITHGGNGASLHYDVHGLVSLKKYLRRHVLDDVAFRRMLLSVRDVLDTCNDCRVPTELIVFDPSYVFVDGQAQPRFVVTPLDNVPYTLGNSPLTMLGLLGTPRRLKFDSPKPEMLSSKLEAFVLNQNNVFSMNAFRTFLRDQCDERSDREDDNRDDVSGGILGMRGEDEEHQSRVWNGLDERRSTTIAGGPARPGYVLVRISDGASFRLSEGQPTAIGRGSKNAIQLTGNQKLSRSHAVLRCSGNEVFLMDLNSANGTWVRGNRLGPKMQARIPLNQVFSLANEDFVVRRG